MEERNWKTVDGWMRQYGDRIMRVVYLVVDDYHLAEEITQEVFVRAYNSMSSFRGESSAYTWLYRIALNLSKNYLSRQAKIRFLPLEEKKEDIFAVPVEDEIVKSTVGQKIRECIKKLPLIYREVIILHYFEDMKVGDIARVLKRPEGTVKSMLYRGRELLEDMIRREGLGFEGER